MRPSPLGSWSGAAALCVAIAGCSDNTDPEDGIAGTYAATELVQTNEAGSVDILAAGGEITIVLDDGTTSGTMIVPGAFTESGEQETESLAGTYAYDAEAGTVTFDHAGDTFIRDITWTVEGVELHGTFTSGETILTATLERQD